MAAFPLVLTKLVIARQAISIPTEEGSAHAQFLFQTDQRDRVMREILRLLSMP